MFNSKFYYDRCAIMAVLQIKSEELDPTPSSTIRNIAYFTIKLIALTLVLLVVYGFAAGLAGLTADTSSVDPTAAFTGTMLMITMYTIALSYPISRSRWRGWRLALIIAVGYYTIAVFLPQLDTIIFLDIFVDIIDVSLVPKILIQGRVSLDT